MKKIPLSSVSISLLFSFSFSERSHILAKVFGGRRTEEVVDVTRVVVVVAQTETESFEDALEDEDMTGDTEDALLLVAVLLSRFVQKLHEDRVVQKLRADHESFHLITYVDRHVTFRHRVRPPELGRCHQSE